MSNIAGAAAEGMLVTMPKRYDQDPANSAIVNALKAEKKDPSGPYVWITYAAVQSLAQAMDRTGSQQPLDLIKDLKAHGAKTVIGPLTWDEKGGLQRLFRRARRAVGVPLEDTKLKSLQIAFFIPGQRPNHGFRPVRFQIFD